MISDFGDRVAGLRTAKGLSQQQLANKSGMQRSYIGGVERGERNISLWNIGRIAAALGVAIALLFVPEPVMFPEPEIRPSTYKDGDDDED